MIIHKQKNRENIYILEKNPFPSDSCDENSHVSLGSRGDGGLPFAFYQTQYFHSRIFHAHKASEFLEILGKPMFLSLCPHGPKRVYIRLPLLWDNKVEED
jgi:hypothetical protein